MKKLLAAVLSLFLFVGCKSSDQLMNQAIAIRQDLENADCSTFECSITADYGDKIHIFTLDCVYLKDGRMEFTVTSPDSIAGITGQMDASSGKLTFDGHVLAFPLLADGYISPICSPWLLMKTLRGGYIHSCAQTEQGLCVTIDDTFENEALTVRAFFDEDQRIDCAEFIWDGRRILAVEIRNFSQV